MKKSYHSSAEPIAEASITRPSDDLSRGTTVPVASGVQKADAAETLNVCHGGHPIMEASIKILDKWAKKFDVNLTSTTVAYAIFVPKITQILTTNSPKCDIIWHNDDWGQLWKQYLVTT